MFDIEYKGGNCVVVTTKKTKLVVDPALSVLGLKDLDVNDQVSLATESRLSVKNSDAAVVIDGPGEYEARDFTIRGVAIHRYIDDPNGEKLSTMYRLEVGECSVGVLGNILPDLSEDQLESLGVIDILILPVGGGGYTLDATSAAAIVRNIDPKVVIPVHFADSGLKYETIQDSLSIFVKELGASSVEPAVAKYKIKSSASLPDTLTVQEISRS